MSNYDILTQQIADQIEGRTELTISFTNADKDYVSLYKQLDDEGNFKFWIEPAFCKAKYITEEVYEELINKAGSEQHIDSEVTFDDFYNKYYNNK